MAIFRNKLQPFISTLVRQFSETRQYSEKSINHVSLLGRVGITPQQRGSEEHPVVIFTLATNSNYKNENGDYKQKTDWHRISIFRPFLRNTVMEYLKKGARVYVEGRLMYGEVQSRTGEVITTTTIVADEVIFLSGTKASEENVESME